MLLKFPFSNPWKLSLSFLLKFHSAFKVLTRYHVKLLRSCLFPALTSYYSSVIRPLDILLISWKHLLTILSSSLNLNSLSAWVALVHFYNPITELRFLKIPIFVTERQESMNIHVHGSIYFSPDPFLLSSSQTKTAESEYCLSFLVTFSRPL